MVMKGRGPVRGNIGIKYNSIEQINAFNNLGCPIAYQNTNILLLEYQNCSR